MRDYILVIDQGTTSSRAIIFDLEGKEVTKTRKELKQFYPRKGWVEHDPEMIFQDIVVLCQMALQKSNLEASKLSAVGITNQRETVVVWDKSTGQSVYPAIVWQDRRTSALCEMLKAQGHESMVYEKTGLYLDPYFSATKLQWILNEVPNARARAEQGELLCGTIDCYLLWRLTKGKVHQTDVTNASRTLLFNINTLAWDEMLLNLFSIPYQMLPVVNTCTADFGQLDPSWLGVAVPVTGMAGDQQAATVGQACFKPGMLKSTYGTGCFVLVNTGHEKKISHNKLLSTIAYQIDKQPVYALEGGIFMAGAIIQWLRDQLKLIQTAKETEAIVKEMHTNTSVFMIPAFTGLGAPHWSSYPGAAILGITRDTTREHIVRAGLEAIAFQTKDLLKAIENDMKQPISNIRVDGGMVQNDWLMQYIADLLAIPVNKAKNLESTAIGAFFLAGLGSGLFRSLSEIEALWQSEKHYMPQEKHQSMMLQDYQKWQKGVQLILNYNQAN